jgi:hypothetical protein
MLTTRLASRRGIAAGLLFRIGRAHGSCTAVCPPDASSVLSGCRRERMSNRHPDFRTPSGPLHTLRRTARNELFRFVRRILDTDDGRAMVTAAVRDLLPAAAPFRPTDAMKTHRIYPELGAPEPSGEADPTTRPIFITARFRSGSTLLWNVFRHVDGCTSYYEPFNERRWFDPTRRGDRTDGTHLGVSDYWKEYDGLQELGSVYQDHWIDRGLYMDGASWDPAMEQYVSLLVRAARGRAVLQFNRIDFRLGWFRARYPNATMVHLYRNPRDQWCSSLVDPRRFRKDAAMPEFPTHDHFYLGTWVRDLSRRFRFLDERNVSHPYQLFYYLWKLSYLFGVEHAHYSLAFEHLVRDPERELTALMQAVNMRDFDLARLVRCVADQRIGKWRDYADDEWFRAHESACEAVLERYFGLSTTAERRSARECPAEPLVAAGERL